MSEYQLNEPHGTQDALGYHAEIFTGVRPTSDLTIGNYLGAVRDIVDLQKEHEPVIFVADLHGLTDQPTDVVESHRAALLADYVALGLDLEKSSIYMQSHIGPELGAMTLLLARETTVKGLFSIATTKDKLATELPDSPEGVDAIELREGENVMFALYPILMAADILSMRSRYVPVGKDQVPHIEITRYLADLFNKRHGETFPMPAQWGVEDGREPVKVLALKDIGGTPAKMSKSNPETAILFSDTEQATRKKIMGAQTGNVGELTPHIQSLADMAIGLSSDKPEAAQVADTVNELVTKHLEGGKVMGDFKSTVADVVGTFIEDYRTKRQEIAKDPALVLDALADGNGKAKAVATETLGTMYDRMKISEHNNEAMIRGV